MISPIENNGMVMRMQDFSSVRQNEENVSLNQHITIQNSIDKNGEAVARSVHEKDNSDGADTHHDAREKGRNKYYDTRKKKSKDESLKDGIVVAKGKSVFDITI